MRRGNIRIVWSESWKHFSEWPGLWDKLCDVSIPWSQLCWEPQLGWSRSEMPKISYLEHLPPCFFSLSPRQLRSFFFYSSMSRTAFQGVIPWPGCRAGQCASSGSACEEGCEAFLQCWLTSHWSRQLTSSACSWAVVCVQRSPSNTGWMEASWNQCTQVCSSSGASALRSPFCLAWL